MPTTRRDELIAMREREMADLAQREWRLSLPRGAYAGTYRSPELGTLRVEMEGGELVVSAGALRAEAWPHTERDTVRVELIPGQAMLMEFDVEDTGTTGVTFRLGGDSGHFARN